MGLDTSVHEMDFGRQYSTTTQEMGPWSETRIIALFGHGEAISEVAFLLLNPEIVAISTMYLVFVRRTAPCFDRISGNASKYQCMSRHTLRKHGYLFSHA